MIDTHCHLDQYREPLLIAQRADQLGVLTIGVTHLPSAFEIEFPITRRLRKIRIALGLHPLLVEQHDGQRAAFRKFASQTAFIGEVGLDYSKESRSTQKKQLDSFRFVLETLASLNTKKFITVHSRQAESDVLSCLQDYEISGAIMHWYTGPLGLLEKALIKGHFFSVNPAMVASKKGRNIISRIPKERMLTETDGPYTSIDNRQVEPHDVNAVLRYLQELWKMPINEVAKIIDNNFMKIINEARK